MDGLMMRTPLTITGILKLAVTNYAGQEIVTKLVEGGMHRYTFLDASKRIAQLANALTRMGVKQGDRVGVMGWNTHRQLELYYALGCMGAICHTINPKLGPQNAAFVINHAEDKFVFYDLTFAPLVEALAPHLTSVKGYIAMTDKANAPKSPIKPAVYEELIAKESDSFVWPELDENSACSMCYTSGTTGQPKGVLYSHRGVVLQALVTCLPASFGCSSEDAILPVVPMFHVNAWNVPYAALLIGAKLVMPGPNLDGESLYNLIEAEKVTYSLGVPTVWLNLLNYIETAGKTFSTMKYSLVGGAALSEAIIRGFEKHGVKVRQGWGMTEMSPTGTVNAEDVGFYDLPIEQRIPIQLKQGRALPFLDMRIMSDDGKELPWDGKSSGNLQVRGPWVLSSYYKPEKPTLTKDGWFDTGDVSIIHPDGRMQITDRAKDVIKSGGEWISTLDIENAGLMHPAVAQAAAIGVPHPKWHERPLLIVALKPDASATPEDIREFVCERLPKLSWPDAVEIVDEIPLGATGKVLKTVLREKFKGYVLPDLTEASAPQSAKKAFSITSLFGKK